jgi:hypothetical protein
MRQKKLKINKHSGFIALMSSIIISVILLVMITGLNLSEFYTRTNILDSELKEKSLALAEACTDTAILKIINNSNYNPTNEMVNVDADTCVIQSVSGTIEKTINIQADYQNYFTNLKLKINSATLAIISWEEI